MKTFTLLSVFFLLNWFQSTEIWGQATVYCSATGNSGSYKTGWAVSSARSDGDPSISASTSASGFHRGYAVFNLAGLNIPASATINSVTLTLHFTNSGNTNFTINVYGSTTDFSTLNYSYILYPNIVSGLQLWSQTFGSSSPLTLPSNASIVNFIQANHSSKISLGFADSANTASANGVYTMTGETGSGGSATATAPTLTIVYTCTPTIHISHSGGDTVCFNSLMSFASTITNGGSSPTYQWKKNGLNLSGATSATYSASIANSVDIYTCELTSSASCAATPIVSSNNDTITGISSATPHVSIVPSPGDSICIGAQLALSANAAYGGTNPYFQWKRNGIVIPGVVTASYSPSPINSGDVFSCKMASSLTCVSPDTVISSGLPITVMPVVTPSISITPSPGTYICQGDSVTFTSTPVNPGNTPTYYWRVNGATVPGANGITFSTNSLNNGDSVYAIMVSSKQCANPVWVRSQDVVMAVTSTAGPSIIINAIPSQSICLGETVTFISAVYNFGNMPQYQWSKNGLAIQGETNPTYTTSTLQQGDIINCNLTGNNPCSSSNSSPGNVIVMTVGQPGLPSVVIFANPDTVITTGTFVYFTCQINNAGLNPGLQWYLNGAPIPGANSISYHSSNFNNGDVISLVVHSTNACNAGDSAVSNSEKMVINTDMNVHNYPMGHIGIFPNPNHGTFTLCTSEPGILRLYSIQGVELCQFDISATNQENSLPSFIPYGIYLAKFITNTGNSPGVVKIIYN